MKTYIAGIIQSLSSIQGAYGLLPQQAAKGQHQLRSVSQEGRAAGTVSCITLKARLLSTYLSRGGSLQSEPCMFRSLSRNQDSIDVGRLNYIRGVGVASFPMLSAMFLILWNRTKKTLTALWTAGSLWPMPMLRGWGPLLLLALPVVLSTQPTKQCMSNRVRTNFTGAKLTFDACRRPIRPTPRTPIRSLPLELP